MSEVIYLSYDTIANIFLGIITLAITGFIYYFSNLNKKIEKIKEYIHKLNVENVRIDDRIIRLEDRIDSLLTEKYNTSIKKVKK